MNEDNLNMEIRKFLKKVGITSQRVIEDSIRKANNEGLVKIGDEISLEMTLNIKNFNSNSSISSKIKIDWFNFFHLLKTLDLSIITNDDEHHHINNFYILMKFLPLIHKSLFFLMLKYYSKLLTAMVLM